MSLLRLVLTATPAKLKNLNTRTEKRGKKEFVPAADLKFEIAMGPDILDTFSPTLKTQFFQTEQTLDLAGGMALRENNLVYPIGHMGEMNECVVKVASGVSAEMVFVDAKVNSFKLTPVKGGSVLIQFRVQCKPDGIQAGNLYMMQEQSIELTIEPPDLETMQKNAAKGKKK